MNTRIFIGMLIFILLSGCNDIRYQYVDANSDISPKMSVPIGSTKAIFDFNIPTNYALPIIESDYPTIIAHYSSEGKEANYLKKLEIKFVVDGKEITADETKYEAAHFNDFIDFSENECCEKLGEKLQLGEQKREYVNKYPFGVTIIKKYKSLKRLPSDLSVIMIAITDKGKVEITIPMKLDSYKSSDFIRIH